MYMGKNYTVYIKHDELADEDNKSGLINDLLSKYYKEMAETVTKKREDFAMVGIRTKVESKIEQKEDGDYKATMTVIPNEDDLAAYKARVDICPRHHVPKSDCINQHK